MPKDTFHNLPEEKKKRIIDASIDEFGEYNYDNSNINRIVKAAGVSKGSFYQYFEDKKDLYKYLFTLIGQEKIKYMSPVLANPFNHSFFKVMHDMFYSGLQFAKESPKYMEVGLQLMSNKTHFMYKEIIGDNETVAVSVYKQLLDNGIKNGELREGLDSEFVAKLLYNMSSNIVQYETSNTIDDIEENMLNTLDQLIELMSIGIKKKGVTDD